jgi:hyperosmotically inducible protein
LIANLTCAIFIHTNLRQIYTQDKHKRKDWIVMTKSRRTLISALLMIVALFLFLGLSGCDKEGPAEKAGEKIDQSVEEVKDAAEEAGDKLTGQGPAEELGEKIDDAAEEVKEAVTSKTE